MPEKFKVGDRVSWNSEAGRVSGTIIRVHTRNVDPTTDLDRLGQRLWLDNITRDPLVNGTLQRYVREFAISGLTSNPTVCPLSKALVGTQITLEATLRGQ